MARVKQRPYPAYTEPVVNLKTGLATDTWQQFFNRLLNFVAELTLRGTRAEQPAANTVYPGTIYFVTDENVLEQSNGTAWVPYGTGYSSVIVAILGALDGNGTVGSPLAVRVDGATIAINLSNELQVIPFVKAAVGATPANPTGTASLVGVMMGLAVAITPLVVGTIQLTITGNLSNTSAVAGDGAIVQLRTGTGAAPANAAALTGTARGNAVTAVLTRAVADPVPFALTALVTGLTPGVAVWVDISLAALTGGVAVATQLALSAIEVG